MNSCVYTLHCIVGLRVFLLLYKYNLSIRVGGGGGGGAEGYYKIKGVNGTYRVTHK